MIDFHTHILPGIDDGAKSVAESMSLLRMEAENGVSTVALTPHYNPLTDDFTKFINDRQNAFDLLCAEAEKSASDIRLILGAETAYTPELLVSDLDSLCYENTKTILLELPMEHYPSLAKNVIYELLLKGYTPLLAHAERYPYFFRKPNLLEDLVHAGALVQVSAGALFYGFGTRNKILRMINDGLAHVLATDTHGVKFRPPMLAKAAAVVKKKLGADVADSLVNFEL